MGKLPTTPLHSAKHGDLRVFKLKNISRPEIWEYASLVAPGLDVMECSSKEAPQFYCHLCDDVFAHDSTRLQNLHRHMKSKHLGEIQQVSFSAPQHLQASQPQRAMDTTGVLSGKRKATCDPGVVDDGSIKPPRTTAAMLRGDIIHSIFPSSTYTSHTGHNVGGIHATTFHSRKLGPISLFKVKHINRPEIWMYVSLVAPVGLAPPPATGWTSRDASHFYCHLCDDCFPHDYVRSQNLHRHVKSKHRADVDLYVKKLMRASDKLKPLPSTTPSPSTPAAIIDCERHLVECIASATSSALDLVENPHFLKLLHAIQACPGQFTVPSRRMLESHLNKLYMERRDAVMASLDHPSAACFSLSCHVVLLTVSQIPHLEWTLHHVTQTSFEWRHVPLAFQPLPLVTPLPVDFLNRSLAHVLHEWNLPLSQISVLVSDMDTRGLPVRTLGCLDHLFNTIISSFFPPSDPPSSPYCRYQAPPFTSTSSPHLDLCPPLVSRIAALAQYFNPSTPTRQTLDRFSSFQTKNAFKANTPTPPVACPSQWQPTYHMLYTWQHLRPAVAAYLDATHDPAVPHVSDMDWTILDGFLMLLEPLLQVASMLPSRSQPTPTPPQTAVLLSVVKLLVHDLSNAEFFASRGWPPPSPQLQPQQGQPQLGQPQLGQPHLGQPQLGQPQQLDLQLMAFPHLQSTQQFLHSLLANYIDESALLWISALHPSVAATLAHCPTDEDKTQLKHRLLQE
ncbi:hypothetical protein DYB34_004447 [Aphanomyces astaci]|uniref:BED-type domain-containing protein n=1 Tax=Aphanomyces astaci TaxID=112090 RepID=A0A418BHB9_APHAT|nr:hypothetical protein DYB34_004447 [Aphanomyces astaci]